MQAKKTSGKAVAATSKTKHPRKVKLANTSRGGSATTPTTKTVTAPANLKKAGPNDGTCNSVYNADVVAGPRSATTRSQP